MLSSPPQETMILESQPAGEGDHFRPSCSTFTWREITLIAAISSSQILDEYITSGFFALIPALMHDFSLSARSMMWPTAITSMLVSAFLLLFGRAVDVYGGSHVYVAGITWTLIWTLYAGFATSIPTLTFCRAMQGLGTAAYLPAGLAMLGTIHRPGPRKNMAFSIYGAMAPLGSFIGILVASLALQYAHWRWYFWIGAVLAFVTLSGFLLTRPSRSVRVNSRDIHVDWLGGMSLAVTITLFLYTATEAADAARGRHTIYVIAAGFTTVVGIIVTALIETHVAKQPLLPASIWKVRCMRPLLSALLLSYGAVSLYTCYATLHLREVVGIDPMVLLAWFTPMAVGGCFLAVLGGYLMSKVSGTSVLIVTCLAVIAAATAFLCMPSRPSYWVWVFPAMICATTAIDLVYSVVNVFLSSELSEDQQGIAGSLAHALVRFSDTLLLGVARAVTADGLDSKDRASYRGAFWLQVACGVGALCIVLLCVRIGKAPANEEVKGDDKMLEDESQELSIPT